MLNKGDCVTYTLTGEKGVIDFVDTVTNKAWVSFVWGNIWVDNKYLQPVQASTPSPGPTTVYSSTGNNNWTSWYGMPFGDSGYSEYKDEELKPTYTTKCECGQRKAARTPDEDHYLAHSDYCAVYKEGKNENI